MATEPVHGPFEGELGALKEKDQYRSLVTLSRRAAGEVHREGRSMLNLSSNDYLGIGSDEALLSRFLSSQSSSAGDLLDERGMTSSSSRLLTGNSPAYEMLEKELSDLYDSRDCLLFSSGYHANVGILPALGGKGDLFLSDRLNHASIIDGLRLSRADFRRYRHCDCDHLEELLRKAVSGYRRIFIVTESVFSMDGDLADLERLVRLKEEYGAMLIVDEAHAIGVFGGMGRGLADALGVLPRVDVLVGTFGKALASSGAFAVTGKVLKEYLVNTARPLIFTTALPPAQLQWSRFTLRRMTELAAERERLAAVAGRLRKELEDKGCPVRGASQIVPVVVGENEKAVRLAGQLRDRGFLVFPIRPPTVPSGTARIRISLTADVTWGRISALPELVEEFLR